jgi:hypothetical protein
VTVIGHSYSPKGRTDADKVRLLVWNGVTPDVDALTGADRILDDGEIETFLDLTGQSIFRAAALACMSASARITATSIKVEGLSIDKKDASKLWLERAAFYNTEADMNENIVEEIDSTSYEIGLWGGDASEYVG